MPFIKEEIEHIEQIEQCLAPHHYEVDVPKFLEGELSIKWSYSSHLTQTIQKNLNDPKSAPKTRFAICFVILKEKFGESSNIVEYFRRRIKNQNNDFLFYQLDLNTFDEFRFAALCMAIKNLDTFIIKIENKSHLSRIKKIVEEITNREKNKLPPGIIDFDDPHGSGKYIDLRCQEYSHTMKFLTLFADLSKDAPEYKKDAAKYKNELANTWSAVAAELIQKNYEDIAMRMLSVVQADDPNYKNAQFEIFEYVCLNSINTGNNMLTAFLEALPYCKDQKDDLILFDSNHQKKTFDAILSKVVDEEFSPETNLLGAEKRQEWVKKVESVKNSLSILNGLKKDYPELSEAFEKVLIPGKDLLDDKKREQWMSKIKSVDDMMYHLKTFRIDRLNVSSISPWDRRKYNESINNFYQNAIPIILSDKTKPQQRIELKRLAHQQFSHRHFLRRALADALMLISICFAGIGLAVVFSRLARHKPFLFSLSPTDREKEILKRIDCVEGYKC